MAHCSRKNFLAIPTGFSDKIRQVILNENNFANKMLVSANFSQLLNVKSLYLGQCSIEQIHVDTFKSLKALEFLDLSANRITYLSPGTFEGLNLKHLFLNGNQFVTLGSNTFAGLRTEGLYLHGCSLKNLEPEVLEPLESLKNLWLHENLLSKLNEKLLKRFSGLSHLRLASNPLACDCESLWLKRFYDERKEDIFFEAPSPSCWSPKKFKNLTFDKFSVEDLQCSAPILSDVDLVLNTTSATLKCTAFGNPGPNIFWIEPSGKSTVFRAKEIKDSNLFITEATLEVNLTRTVLVKRGPNKMTSVNSPPDNKQQKKRRKKKKKKKEYNQSVYDNLYFDGNENNNDDYDENDGNSGDENGHVQNFYSMMQASNLEDSDDDGHLFMGQYFCIAQNNMGNVTLTVNLTLPLSALIGATQAPQAIEQNVKNAPTIIEENIFNNNVNNNNNKGVKKHRPNYNIFHSNNDNNLDENNNNVKQNDKNSLSSNNNNKNNKNLDSTDNINDDDDSRAFSSQTQNERLYSVLEMSLAVAGTFLSTILLCVVALLFFVNRQRFTTRKKHQDDDDRKKPSANDRPTHPYFNSNKNNNTSVQQQLETSGVESDGSHLYAETIAPLYPTVDSYPTSGESRRTFCTLDVKNSSGLGPAYPPTVICDPKQYQLQHTMMLKPQPHEHSLQQPQQHLMDDAFSLSLSMRRKPQQQQQLQPQHFLHSHYQQIPPFQQQQQQPQQVLQQNLYNTDQQLIPPDNVYLTGTNTNSRYTNYMDR
ncbi:hypothetical protein HELRODRAFT_174564 [Helobdella robusta]|uniref:LRRCT domain-containing protein n=1 Tax=Helobdella robusta TaxID=6412 RepID=T1F894_HELRO|nr:hypothetical protein HELRODRAFT_174564 [Helobdella robusta]ESO01606.1 hypothetical protein HELRODRAFT_174564 [Helobdella robusta]